jgi:hypothetical protein
MHIKADFTYRASIDWIEFEIETVLPSNFNSIREIAKTSYVHAVNKGLGGSATIFRFKYYDVETWRELEEKVIKLSSVKELVREPKIIAIEVSFDAKGNGKSKDDLIKHTAEFVRMLTNPLLINNKMRAASYKGSAEQLWLKKENDIQASRNSFYLGSQRGDDTSMRIYWKQKDRGTNLPIDKQVARAEVTLKDNSCPFNTIEEAKSYQFSELRQWFKFRKVKEGLDGLSQVSVDWESQVGRKGNWKVRTGDKKKASYRVYHPSTVSDTKLSNTAYEKLRQLTKRLNRVRFSRETRLTHK